MKEREIKAMIADAGLTLLDLKVNGHFKARVRAPDGREGVQVFSKSPGGGRGLENRRAELRRFARGN
jgi:hypothetical protein